MQMTGDLGATDQIKKQNGDALSSAIAQKNVRNWTETLEKQREIISRTHSAKKGKYRASQRGILVQGTQTPLGNTELKRAI